MEKTFLRCALLLFVLLMCSSVFGQQRWFENGTSGTLKRLSWENVAIIYLSATATSSTGARVVTYSNGKYENWGNMPKGSTSLVKLQELIDAKKERWAKGQPQNLNPNANGRFYLPTEIIAYFDINRISTFSKATPAEFGQEVYVLTDVTQ